MSREANQSILMANAYLSLTIHYMHMENPAILLFTDLGKPNSDTSILN